MKHVQVPTVGGSLAATLSGENPCVVFLHPGVGDRRCWFDVMALMAGELPGVAFDRRGFGETPPAEEPFDNIEDVRAVLDTCINGRATLVGNSQGGRVAIDFALAHPERVDLLVLIAPGVSGAPETDLVAELGAGMVEAIGAAEETGDLDEVNRYEALVWLDGPAGPEGRVSGAARELFLAMNLIALQNESAPQPIEPVPAWQRLECLTMPVLVMVGTRDLQAARARARTMAERIPGARLVELDGLAHLPQLESPERVTASIRAFVQSDRASL